MTLCPHQTDLVTVVLLLSLPLKVQETETHMDFRLRFNWRRFMATGLSLFATHVEKIKKERKSKMNYDFLMLSRWCPVYLLHWYRSICIILNHGFWFNEIILQLPFENMDGHCLTCVDIFFIYQYRLLWDKLYECVILHKEHWGHRLDVCYD